jgi:hypothetical protein
VLDLYDAVARGMWAYSHAAFRVETLGQDRFRLEPGTVILATHRRETDVPILASSLYFGGDLRRNHGDRMHFSARDDMFLPGFFAGFPNGLPAWARRLLYPIDVARGLAVVKVHPIRSARVARLGEVLRARPDDPLDGLLPEDLSAQFRGRASSLEHPPPQRAGDVVRAEYADLLWRAVGPDDLPRDELAGFWSARAAQAAREFRALVELLRSDGTLLVFPEGRPSPDGEIGPLRPGIGALLRRGRPRCIRPLGLAYDPLVRGRTRVWVTFPAPVAPPEGSVEDALLALMRRSVPLTAGQFAANRLQAGAAADPVGLRRELAEAVEAARAEDRPVERELLEEEGRRRRLAEALAVAPRKPEALPFLAREYESARTRA